MFRKSLGFGVRDQGQEDWHLGLFHALTRNPMQVTVTGTWFFRALVGCC